MTLVRSLLVVLVLLVAADAAVTIVAERQAAAQVGDVLGAPATVDLRGWPVSVHLVRGVIPAVEVTAEGAPLGPVRLERLEATMLDVQEGLSAVLDPPSGLPPFASGTFAADLAPAGLARLLPAPPGLPMPAVSFEGGELRVDFGGQIGFSAPVDVGPDGLTVRTGTAVLGDLQVPLPPLPGGAVVRSAAIEPGRTGLVLRLRGSLHGSP